MNAIIYYLSFPTNSITDTYDKYDRQTVVTVWTIPGGKRRELVLLCYQVCMYIPRMYCTVLCCAVLCYAMLCYVTVVMLLQSTEYVAVWTLN